MTRRRRSRPIWRASSNEWRPSSHGCGAEPPRASGKPLTLGAGLLGPRDSILDHDRRPQADRHPLRRDRVRVLPAGRPRGALDPAPARGTGRARRQRRDVQRALHDARHDDGVPRDHAAQRAVLQLHSPAADRRPRRRLPAPQRALVLDLPLRRPVPERELPRRDAARRRLVRLRQPEVYILILPAFGIVSEVLPTFARKPLFGAPVVIYSGVLIGFFGFGVWSHHMFAAGMGPIADAAFSIATMLIAIPTGVKIFNWLATLWGGAIRTTTALHFAVGLVGLFTIGGLSGIMHASPPVDLQQTDSYFVVAHLHYVLIGGSLFGLFAGTYYWWPKMTGRLLGERLGRLHFWVLFAGFNLAFFPQHYLGALGMPRRIYTYAPDAGWTTTNFASTVGAFGIGVGVLLFMINAWRSLRRGAPALADPWDGRTLEWRTSSPPPAHDFDTIPPIYGRDTYWREKYGRPRGGLPSPGSGASLFHLPSPSHWPVVIALGMGMAAVGALTHVSPVLVGVLMTVFGVFRLALEHHRTPAHAHQTGGLGLDHRKVAMWVFLGSECFFFGTLIATYLAYRGRSVVGPEPHEILNIPLTTVSTFDLLMSSLLMVLALAAVERDDRRHARLWLFGTAFFGLIFLGFQAYEFTHFVGEGLTLQQNLFGSTFFVLTGLHGAHVALGVVWLLALWMLDLRGRLAVADAVKVEIAGLYWHFVDIVWIAIFTLVYLIP